MSESNKKTVLVTGALGHIGSRLIRNLDKDKIEGVRLLDNLESQRYASLFNLPSDPNYEFIESDIREADFEKVLSGVDAVVHLAALTDAANSTGRAQEVMSVNLEGLKRVAKACEELQIPLLFPSTTSVYGSQESRVDETCTELKPQSPYAESKLLAEQYLQSRAGTLRFVICRFGTIFGPSVGMRFHTAVNKFIWQAVTKQPITVWKTAWEQKRPYLDLSDCVSAVNHILNNQIFDGEIYNVVTNNYTVKQVVETIQKFVPDCNVTFVDSAIMNQLSYEIDGKKFSARGFNPKGDLEKGVKDTVVLIRNLIT